MYKQLQPLSSLSNDFSSLQNLNSEISLELLKQTV